MKIRWNKIAIFMKRDWKNFVSYPVSMLFSFISIFFTLFIFYFLSQVISVKGSIAKYTDSYFAFVIIGIAFSTAVATGLNSIVSSIRSEQMKGTFEFLTTGDLSSVEFLLGSLSFNMLYEILRIFLTILFAVLFFNLKIYWAKSYISFIFLILTFFVFLSFGIFSAGIIIITKKGNPLSFLINQANVLFSGVYFPYEILPKWLIIFSYIFPTTYALKAIRLNLLKGVGLSQLYHELIIMIVLTVIFLPLSILFFNHSIKKAKEWGILGNY